MKGLWQLWRRVLWPLTRLAAVAALLLGGLAVFMASRQQPDFKPVIVELPAELKAYAAKTKGYQRQESTTYLSFPEWYLVFQPQGYARYLEKHTATRYPYFGAIAQFWNGYAQVFAITSRHYPFNAGDHLMELVLGFSTMFEYSVKGVYEKTVGRVSEWTAFGERVPEDDYAAKAAKAYGDFIPTDPWFMFDFKAALKGLWAETPFFGKHFLRKLERKAFMSFEYAAKWAYAGLIEKASRSIYGVADTEVYCSVTGWNPKAGLIKGVRFVEALPGGISIVTLPHYQGFTDTAPLLAAAGVDFIEIGGADEILMTYSHSGPPKALRGDLFEMPGLDDPEHSSAAQQVPVRELSHRLRALSAMPDAKLQHLYDY